MKLTLAINTPHRLQTTNALKKISLTGSRSGLVDLSMGQIVLARGLSTTGIADALPAIAARTLPVEG
jgi:hypothetical protein